MNKEGIRCGAGTFKHSYYIFYAVKYKLNGSTCAYYIFISFKRNGNYRIIIPCSFNRLWWKHHIPTIITGAFPIFIFVRFSNKNSAYRFIFICSVNFYFYLFGIFRYVIIIILIIVICHANPYTWSSVFIENTTIYLFNITIRRGKIGKLYLIADSF